jgi:hypothetical protein
MKIFTFVLATLAAIATTMPSIAGTEQGKQQGATSHGKNHGAGQGNGQGMGQGKPKNLQHRMHNHMVE